MTATTSKTTAHATTSKTTADARWQQRNGQLLAAYARERSIDSGWIRYVGDGPLRADRLGSSKGAGIIRNQGQAGARRGEPFGHAQTDAAAGTRDNHLPAGNSIAHR